MDKLSFLKLVAAITGRTTFNLDEIRGWTEPVASIENQVMHDWWLTYDDGLPKSLSIAGSVMGTHLSNIEPERKALKATCGPWLLEAGVLLTSMTYDRQADTTRVDGVGSQEVTMRQSTPPASERCEPSA